jgi:hypothetical protein
VTRPSETSSAKTHHHGLLISNTSFGLAVHNGLGHYDSIVSNVDIQQGKGPSCCKDYHNKIPTNGRIKTDSKIGCSWWLGNPGLHVAGAQEGFGEIDILDRFFCLSRLQLEESFVRKQEGCVTDDQCVHTLWQALQPVPVWWLVQGVPQKELRLGRIFWGDRVYSTLIERWLGCNGRVTVMLGS